MKSRKRKLKCFQENTVNLIIPVVPNLFLWRHTISYLNFRGTPITLVNNKKVFTEDLSMVSHFRSKIMIFSKKKKVFTENFSIISQFSSQNHGDL